MSAKPKIAFYWCASCGGCEETVVDLAEDILGVLDAVEIVFWPVALDFKRADVERLPDGAIAASFINGAVRTSEQAEMVSLLRRKSQVVVAFGACAQLGGIPGLANQFEREQILRYVYEDAPTVDSTSRTRPVTLTHIGGEALELPVFHQGVRTLPQVITVDYFIPGCPPTPKLTQAAVTALLSGTLPPRGAVLAPDEALCEQCPRKATKPADLSLAEFHRAHQIRIDSDRCLLAQGVVCMGPATRGGCEATCPSANMPCTGCFGPTSRVRDQGAKMLSCLSATIAAKDEAGAAATLAGIPDPVGTFYRYALPASLLRRRQPGAPAPDTAEPATAHP